MYLILLEMKERERERERDNIELKFFFSGFEKNLYHNSSSDFLPFQMFLQTTIYSASPYLILNVFLIHYLNQHSKCL